MPYVTHRLKGHDLVRPTHVVRTAYGYDSRTFVILVSSGDLSLADAFGPPMEQRGGAHEIGMSLQHDTTHNVAPWERPGRSDWWLVQRNQVAARLRQPLIEPSWRALRGGGSRQANSGGSPRSQAE